MANISNAKQFHRLDDAASKEIDLHGNAENDDDDDVVIDKETPRANGESINRDRKESEHRITRDPETVAVHKKGYVKPDSTMEKIDKEIDDITEKRERAIAESNLHEITNGLRSMKSEKGQNAQEVGQTNGKVEACTQKVPAAAALDDSSSKTKADDEGTMNKANSNGVEQFETTKPSQEKENSNMPATNPGKSPATLSSELSEDKSHQPQAPESPRRLQNESSTDITSESQKSAPVEPQKNLQELDATRKKESNDPRAGSLSGTVRDSNEQQLKSPRPSPESESQSTITESTDRVQGVESSKIFPPKEDKNIPKEIKEEEALQSKNKCEPNRQIPKAETGARVNHSKESTRDEDAQEVEASPKMSNAQHITSPRVNENRLNTEKSSSEQPPEETLTNRDYVSGEQNSVHVVSKCSNESLHGDKDLGETTVRNVSENRHSSGQHEERSTESTEANVTGALQKPPTLLKDSEKNVELSSDSQEENVKGFDDGQRSALSRKSSSSQSSRSLASPKSPAADEGKKSSTSTQNETTRTESTSAKAAEARILLEPTASGAPDSTTATASNEKSEIARPAASEIEYGNITNESVQSKASATNGVEDSPTKKSPCKGNESDARSSAGSPVKSPNKSVKSLSRTPETPSSTGSQEKKKLPMNKIQVGSAPSPNLKTVRSKIGSLENASYKPGGGKVKIENRKLDFSKAQPKIAAKNEKYTPSGGDKKITQVKLQWNAKPKVGSLENATYKPGGGDKKIETVKLDFKDKAKPKVGSKENAKHVPGGGSVKSSTTPANTPQGTSNDIQTQKVDIKAESKIGSLDNVKHKPGGGDKKIFNDKEYFRQTGSNVEGLCGSGSQSPVPPSTDPTGKNGLPTSDENLNQEC